METKRIFWAKEAYQNHRPLVPELRPAEGPRSSGSFLTTRLLLCQFGSHTETLKHRVAVPHLQVYLPRRVIADFHAFALSRLKHVAVPPLQARRRIVARRCWISNLGHSTAQGETVAREDALAPSAASRRQHPSRFATPRKATRFQYCPHAHCGQGQNAARARWRRHSLSTW